MLSPRFRFRILFALALVAILGAPSLNSQSAFASDALGSDLTAGKKDDGPSRPKPPAGPRDGGDGD